MKVWATVEDPSMPLVDVAAYAGRAEKIGFEGLLIPESVHDAFLTAMLALEHTTRLKVATSVALAFPRSPTTTAHACLLYTSPSPRDKRQSRMPSSA